MKFSNLYYLCLIMLYTLSLNLPINLNPNGNAMSKFPMSKTISNINTGTINISNQISATNHILFNTIKVKYPHQVDCIVNTSIQKYSYEFMKNDIDKLIIKYKGLVSTETIGKSVLGRNIPVIILGGTTTTKKLLVIGSIHGREYITSELIMKQIEEYLKNYNGKINGLAVKKILSKTSIYFIPILNPDGVALSQFGIKSIADQTIKSKILLLNKSNSNFALWKSNINGIDLNRNFNSGWIKLPKKSPSSEKSKGPYPESEPESKAIVNYINKYKFNILISYHAAGSLIYWYNNQTGKDYNRDFRIAQKISQITKYTLVKPSKSNSEGGLKDWFIPTYKKTGLTIEIGKNCRCPVPIKEFSKIWSENRIVPLFLAQSIK